MVDVYLDNVNQGRVDTYSSSDVFQVAVFTSGALSPGSHIIQLRATGAKNAASTGTWIGFDRATATG